VGYDGGHAPYVLVPETRFLAPIGNLDPVQAAPLTDAGITTYSAIKPALLATAREVHLSSEPRRAFERFGQGRVKSHVDVKVGDQPVRAIEIIGERDGQEYLARRFDSVGNVEVMRLTIDEAGVFHFSGSGNVAPASQPRDAPTVRVRSTLTVGEGSRTMSAQWERSQDGATWRRWMDITFER
jgi:hypothetical protein